MTPGQTLEALADRIRDVLAGDPRITEKKMFGGITFLLNGRILVGAKKDGRMLAHVGREDNEQALRRDGAEQMIHGNRPMLGFVWVDRGAIDDDEALRDWITLAERWAAAQPPR